MSNYLQTNKNNPCPVCGDTSAKCRTFTDSPIVLCMDTIDQYSTPHGWKFLGTTSGSYLAGKLVPTNHTHSTDLEWRVERDRRSAAKAATEEIERANLPSLTDRHKLLSNKPHTLTTSQNADLLRRGLFQSEIDDCLSRGYLWAERGGYGIAAIDPETGLIVGGQIAKDDRKPKYTWGIFPGKNKLPETNQNPLPVWKSPDFDTTKPAEIRFCEAFLKPLISALMAWRSNPQVIYIGAGGTNFQDKALERVLSALPSTESLTLYPDAGAVSNHGVMQAYQKLELLLRSIPGKRPPLQVAWWGQYEKPAPDCDELLGTESIVYLSWEKFQQKSRKDVTTIVNQRYLEKIALPLLASSVFTSSPTGTGKTEILEDLVHQFLVMHPDGLADLIGYRNGLLVQTVLRTANKGRVNTVHKFNMEEQQAGWYGFKSLAYCVNSLDQRLDALNRAINEGRKVLIILDEVGFIANHCFGMMKSQPQTVRNFARLLRRIGEGHGYIAGLQANLSEETINFIQELTRKNFPLAIVRNEYKPPTWDVKIIDTYAEGIGGLSPKLLDKGHSIGAANTALEDLKAGKFILVTTSAQKFAETLDTLSNGQGFRLLRVDAYTVAAAREAKKSNDTEEYRLIRQIFKSPKEAIERAKAIGYHGVILTPTAETGVSIDGVNFDHIIEYAPNGTSEAVLQRLARDRNNSTPRSIFATNRAADYRAEVFSSPESVLKGWNINKKQGFNAARVLEVLNSEEQEIYDTEEDELLSIIARYAAQSVAAQNNDRRELNLNIERRLQEDGHSVVRSNTEVSSEFCDLWKIAKTTVADRNFNLFAKSPVIPSDEAHEVIKGGRATREKLYSAQKTIKLESYPGLDLNDVGLVERLIFNDRGAALSYITQTWMLKNPAVAQQIDRACWKAHLERGIVWAPSLKREALKSQTLADTGILEIIELEEYCETTPEVMKLRAYCIQNSYQLRRVCGYAAAFNESHSGIRMVGWILARLNYKQRVSRKQSVELKAREKKEQIRHWKVIDLNKGDRTLVEAALTQKWEALEPLQDKEYTHDSHDFSVINQDRKIVTIPTIEPDEPKTYGLKIVSDSDDSETYEYIPTPEELAEWEVSA